MLPLPSRVYSDALASHTLGDIFYGTWSSGKPALEVSATGQATGDHGAKEKRNLEWSRLFTGSCSAEVQSKMRDHQDSRIV